MQVCCLMKIYIVVKVFVYRLQSNIHFDVYITTLKIHVFHPCLIYIKRNSNTEKLLHLPLLNTHVIITIYTYNSDVCTKLQTQFWTFSLYNIEKKYYRYNVQKQINDVNLHYFNVYNNYTRPFLFSYDNFYEDECCVNATVEIDFRFEQGWQHKTPKYRAWQSVNRLSGITKSCDLSTSITISNRYLALK